MPLLQKKRLSGGTSTTDTGYDSQSLDSSQTSKLRESLEMSSHDIDEDSQHAEWLQSLGFKEEHIKKIQSTQVYFYLESKLGQNNDWKTII